MFITNIVQFAVKGYSVQAMDFIVKPIDYSAFANKLEAAIKTVLKRSTVTARIKTLSGLMLFDLDEIVCVEIISRKLFIHTRSKSYQCNETLQGIEEKLKDERFYRCHAAYLVNLQHVHQIDKTNAIVANRQVPISRHRLKGLMDALTKYLGT
jgi:DNA-binding LytR/AlgR family response regulator